MHFQSVHFSAIEPGPRLIVLERGARQRGVRLAGHFAGDRRPQQRSRTRLLRGSVTFVPVTNPLAYNKGSALATAT